MKFIKWFDELTIKDVAQVGGKNASLGEMFSQLKSKDIEIPNGFAITSQAYWLFLQSNKIENTIKKIINDINPKNIKKLQINSRKIRKIIESGNIPEELELEIINSYKKLCSKKKNCAVAIRSSATAEDLPTASFAGQQESFLNIRNSNQLLIYYKKCLSSLFTPRAIIYRIENGFNHFKVGLSAGVQEMIRSDLASSGVAFTLDTETGFKDVVFINSSWGLAEAVVQGAVNPDSFFVHKPTLELGFKPILKKELGKKRIKTVYANHLTKNIVVDKSKQNIFSLSDSEILDVANKCLIIEKHYSELNKKWTPMDIEWAKDGINGKIYIIQARYETIHAHEKNKNKLIRYLLDVPDKELNQKLILTGQSIGQKIVSGTAKVIKSSKEINKVKVGDILVTQMTDPDWVPIMKKAAGIITNEGGRTCHAAIVSRELGIPAIIGTEIATKKIKNGSKITLDCSSGEVGKIYSGEIPFKVDEIEISKIKKPLVKIMVNSGTPDKAFAQSFLPVDGVGLARLEFIITNNIKIHPMALVHFNEIKDKKIKKEINEITLTYKDKKKFFVDTLAQEAGTIAAAFYPRTVIIRLSDFKSNEYRNLIGGNFFEPEEENPMIGLRGASRYYSNLYKDAFELECKAMKKIRDEMGLTNVKLLIPFVRTVQEGEKVLNLMKKFGLEKTKNGLEIIMMCEIPSNVILIDQFCKDFDGFSIGSNDLTQLTLAIDRDSNLLAYLFDENNDAVKKMLSMVIDGANKNNKPIGICGQAPSDYPDLAKFLIQQGIDSISLNYDSVIPFLLNK